MKQLHETRESGRKLFLRLFRPHVQTRADLLTNVRSVRITNLYFKNEFNRRLEVTSNTEVLPATTHLMTIGFSTTKMICLIESLQKQVCDKFCDSKDIGKSFHHAIVFENNNLELSLVFALIRRFILLVLICFFLNLSQKWLGLKADTDPLLYLQKSLILFFLFEF